MDKARLTVA